MNKAVINIRTKAETKKMAQKKAEKLGLSLSGVMNGFLQEFISTNDFHVSLGREEPSEWLKQQLKESEADRKAGRVRSFKSIDDSLPWLKSLRNDS